MVDRTVSQYGRVDMAFNNAGIQVPPSDAADEPLENFERGRVGRADEVAASQPRSCGSAARGRGS